MLEKKLHLKLKLLFSPANSRPKLNSYSVLFYSLFSLLCTPTGILLETRGTDMGVRCAFRHHFHKHIYPMAVGGSVMICLQMY